LYREIYVRHIEEQVLKVLDLLQSLGFNDVWLSQAIDTKAVFIGLVKQR
jgi:hypothetical protein